MECTITREHRWLDKLVGDWTAEVECQMGPDQPPSKSGGVESVRSLGGLWTIGEGQMDTPDGSPMKSIMTLGFDPTKGRFVGTFIASMMTHLWSYDGALDASEKILTLDAEGPAFSGEGMAKYQDIVEFVDENHRILKSQFQDEHGNWQHFMTAHYHRK